MALGCSILKSVCGTEIVNGIKYCNLYWGVIEIDLCQPILLIQLAIHSVFNSHAGPVEFHAGRLWCVGGTLGKATDDVSLQTVVYMFLLYFA